MSGIQRHNPYYYSYYYHSFILHINLKLNNNDILREYLLHKKLKKNKQHLGIGIHCGCLCGGSTLGYGVTLLGNENENTGCDMLYPLLHSKFETLFVLFAYSGVQHILCCVFVLFLFVLPNVVSFSGLSIFDCLSVFSYVYCS
jgi:hypothetical protein